MRYRVGTAGWSVPSAHRHSGSPSHLAQYAGMFDSVEINSSFYKTHRTATYQRWAASVPATFRFSVKLPQTITHEAGLVGCVAEIEDFCESVAGLGKKLGVVLIQLPPTLQFSSRPAAALFKQLQSRLQAVLACEARHRTWFTPQADRLLDKWQVARVLADPPIEPGSHPMAARSKLAYCRLHGQPRRYYSSYAAADLTAWAGRLRSMEPKQEVWCIFDNTASGYAWPNAVDLRALLRNSAAPPRRRRPT